MSMVFIGPMPRFTSPSDFYVNRARNRTLPLHLTLGQAGLLCVSDDAGENLEKARAATTLLYSFKAGGLLSVLIFDGKEFVDSAGIRAVASRLQTAGILGEGVRLWLGLEAEALIEQAAPEVDDEWLSRSDAINRAAAEGMDIESLLGKNATKTEWLKAHLNPRPGNKTVNWTTLYPALCDREAQRKATAHRKEASQGVREVPTMTVRKP